MARALRRVGRHQESDSQLPHLPNTPRCAVVRPAEVADTERPSQPSRAIAWANSASYSRMLLTDLEAHSVARLHDSQCSAASARNTVPQEASRCTASGLVSGQRSRTVDQWVWMSGFADRPLDGTPNWARSTAGTPQPAAS